MSNIRRVVERELLKMEKSILMKNEEISDLERNIYAARSYLRALDGNGKQRESKRDIVHRILINHPEGLRPKDMNKIMIDEGLTPLDVKNNLGVALSTLLKNKTVCRENGLYKICLQ